ncbi:MAG: Rpn family recombination-promoting nuclease/putative transposase [Fibromonadales bacterium]|nr:Rpn family recombination-promoting nuclease/putative transposase [Fibromonadales bacterium]
MPEKTKEANREFKSSLFTMLFSIKENSLSLINAVDNANYGSDTNVKITTLGNALVKGPKNDISFMLDGKILVLIEHQSTINNNMALRFLIYIARIYERITGRKDRYRKERISIPKPEFVVLYNGNEDMPEVQELKLSDMFKDLGEEELPKLDLTVKVLNINKGHNEELVNRSMVLREYSTFVYLVKEYAKSMELGDAILKAIDDCKRQNVLRDFLAEHEQEVYNMLLGDWNWDEAREVWEEEAMNKGVAIGEARGVAIGEARIARQMKAKGFNTAVISEMTGLPDEEIERL